MIIDFHTHAFPDDLAQRALHKLSVGTGQQPHTDGTCLGLIEAAQKAGVERCVVLSIAVKPNQMHTVNNFAWKSASPYLIPFGSIHPYAPDARDEILRLKDLGFLGVKLHPEYQQFPVDDPAVFPVYEALAKAGLITVFHAGYDPAFSTPQKASPIKLKKALPNLEGTAVVAAHMGGQGAWLEVEEHLQGFPHLYLDTAFSHNSIPANAAARLIQMVGPDHVLYGSDSPWSDMGKELEFVRSLLLPPEQERMILGENASRLLYETHC